jgi:histone acetyltransferase 1
MVRTFLADAACFEITVEDPSEVFDDLRDYRDYSRLLVNGTLEQIFMNTNVDPNLVTRRPRLRVPTAHLVDKARLKALRLQNKIAPRQFDRLVEMHLLSKIPPHSRESGTARLTQRAKAKDEGDKAYYFWRLFVKQRIYKRSKDVLKDLEKGEAIIKIEETVTGIKDDYERLLSNLVQRVEDGDTEDMNMVRKQKRKIVDDEDDGEEESKAPQEKSDENMDEDEDGKGRKRVKLS